MNKKSVIIIVLLVVFLGGYLVLPFIQNQRQSNQSDMRTEPKFRKDGTLLFTKAVDSSTLQIDIEVADEPFERRDGLMYRTSMGGNQGMLFLFDREEPQSFWMKNTHISLDIIYVGSDKKIVSIQKYAAPFSEESLPSEGPAQFVVEVNAGYCDNFGIKPGDAVSWQLSM